NTTDDVTGPEPSGVISLRDAINLANAGASSSIVFDPSLAGDTITLAGSELPVITHDVEIDGLGETQLAISGDHLSRIFEIAPGATLTIIGLTIENGSASEGGAIENHGNTNLLRSSIKGNYSYTKGGGIFNNGHLTITNSQVEFNNSD